MGYDKELDSALIIAILNGNEEPVQMILEVLCLAARGGNSELFAEYTGHLHVALAGYEIFPEEFFKAVLQILQKPAFLRLPGSWRLLAIFEPFWSTLLESQKKELFTILEETYAACTDWMVCFTISELLGVCFKDEQALGMLRRLAQAKSSLHRQFAPHGLEHLVMGCLDKDVSDHALRELFRMRADPSGEVTREVEIALARLVKQGRIRNT